MAAAHYYGNRVNSIETKKEEFDKAPLLFGNQVFKKGVNVTVRKGCKWIDNYELGLREVEVGTPDGTIIGKGKLVGAVYCIFCMIPQKILDLEHDPSCRTLEGLYQGMIVPYPDFKMSDEVTVLFFTVD